MNRKKKISESGQAIILIVFAITGMIGMTALTVDGGIAYLDRRDAQNAADTAAFSAARAKIRGEDWKATALTMASLNGYVDTDPGPGSSSALVNVEIYECTETHEPDCGEYADEAFENPEEYIHVLITSTIDTYFGKIIGVKQVTNKVNTITHAQPSIPDPTNFGNAIESLMPGCSGDNGWNKDPYTIAGTGDITITGSGVKVNSSCEDALVQNGSATIDAAAGICVVGTSDIHDADNVSPAPQDNCGEPSPTRQWPNPSCDLDGDEVIDSNEEGEITEFAGLVWVATPGYHDGDFPSGVSGELFLQKGIYCIEGDFSVNSTLNVSTDVNQNGSHDYASEGVLIYLEDGGVTLNGSSELHLHAISDPTADLEIQNLLFFVAPDNHSTVKITGNSDSDFTGSIWAPGSHITLEGTGGTTVNSQVVGYSVDVGGGGGLIVNFDEEQNAVTMAPASIELNK